MDNGSLGVRATRLIGLQNGRAYARNQQTYPPAGWHELIAQDQRLAA